MLVSCRAVTRTDNRRGRVVAVADLHREVVDDWLNVLRAQVRCDPRDVPGVGLLDGQVPDGSALRVIGLQERWPGGPGEHQRQLPGQVVRILDTGVSPVSAIRRDDVRGITGEEHPPALVGVGALGDRLPGSDVLDDDWYAGNADCARSSSSAR